MPIRVTSQFKNLPPGLELPDGDLNILVGPNNSGKTAILQYLNIHSEIRNSCDYVSPRRFDLSNEVTIALQTDRELDNMWQQRKQYNPSIAELTAPDAIRELVSLPNRERNLIIEWHNRYFGELKVEKSNPDNDYAPPRITIDGRLPSEQGSGSRAVLGVLCTRLHPKREIVLIDEPEIGLEPQVQKRLFRLIQKVSRGEDGLPKKRIYLATHSHLFLDRETLENNYIVSRTSEGYATIRQIRTREELHHLIYHLLGNSPDDLFFPGNILVVEGPSDQIFWRRLLELKGARGIAVHYSDGDSCISNALLAIDQMLKTQAYIPWYRERLCVIVDASTPERWLAEWRRFLNDDGSRVRKLSKNGIEYFYPKSIMADLCELAGEALEKQIESFLQAFRSGAKEAALGSFRGSKRDLASEVARRLELEHLDLYVCGFRSRYQLSIDLLRCGALLILMPCPFQETLPVEGLLVPARLPDGDMIVRSLDCQLRPNLVQIEVGAERQVPEAQKGGGRLDLVVIGPQQLFDIAEEGLNLPPRSSPGDDLYQGCVQLTCGPIARLLDWSVQRFPDDEHLATAQFAHTRRDQVSPNFAGSLLGWPDHLLVLIGLDGSGVFAEAHPSWRSLHAQLTVPLQPSCEGEPSPPSRLPEPFAGVPSIHKHVGLGPWNRFEGPDDFLGKVDLAPEPDSLPLGDGPLPVQERRERTTTVQQEVEACQEAVATDLATFRCRVVHPQTLHDLPFRLLVGGVVDHQETCHHGLLGTSHPPGALGPLVRMSCLDERDHLLPETPQPRLCHLPHRPGGLRKEPGKRCQGSGACDLAQQTAQRPPFFTLDEPQQHGHEVLPLGLAETVGKRLCELHQGRLHAYHGKGHGSSLLGTFGFSPYQVPRRATCPQLFLSLKLQT